MSTRVLPIAVILAICGQTGLSEEDPSEEVRSALADARRHLQCGRYDAAAASFASVIARPDAPPQAARAATLGLSAAFESRGLWDFARDAVDDGLRRLPGDASLLARQAELQFQRGDYAAAEATCAAALKIDQHELRARLVQARVFTETGRLEEALESFLWFVRYYNRAQPTDAPSLLRVAEGSLQYARWKSVPDVFDFVINTLCPDALQDDPHCWQAAHLTGAVLLEKYNRPQALRELETALRINPQAAEVLVSLGEAALLESEASRAADFAQQALAINPRLPAALRLAADVALIAGDSRSAMTFIEQARGVNPHDQRTLARQAAAVLLEDGIPDAARLKNIVESAACGGPVHPTDDSSRFGDLWRSLTDRNPRPGLFLTVVGDLLDGRRKYAAAEVCYRRAIELMPQLAAPRTSLGMLLMRTGRLEEAATILDDAFRADPYHVRVSNMRKVVRQLQGYQVIASDHFVIRAPEAERVLAEEMSRYLEGLYEELTGLYGFEPPARTQFEIFGGANGQSAHQWFSARMVGLPWVQTIGASTGLVVAMASPHDQRRPFNWARVARHEFVHVVTLQQSDFNIPHWYTEALAVRTEGVIPESWDLLLLRRVPSGEVFTLEDINRGFTRPEGPTDWDMAYCQSWLYARYIAGRFGENSLLMLVDAYRRNLSTPEAIAEVCGVSMDEFERGYAAHVADYVEEIARERVAPPLAVDAATARWKKNPLDFQARAAVAWSLWHAGDRRMAREIADEVHAAAPDEPLANAILAQSALDDGNVAAAEQLLIRAYDELDPHPAVLERLAKVRALREDWSAARRLWEQGAARWPREPGFLRGLAAVLLRLGDRPRLREVLATIAARDADDALVRKKLAFLAVEAEDWDAAIHWGQEALYCDVRDARLHRLLADVYSRTGDDAASARHSELARRTTIDRK